ncbi:nuclear pore membrane glycoprotein 210 [Microplitis mediator]|uniref:nuclear pore membrane glycoprotein 210 n=1 Tax=Microplitis mediator TaxID=375433 RepID=UPI0025523BB4|nr:nuclear pore membrane glycoprotein 210 [Microplitis mediator]
MAGLKFLLKIIIFIICAITQSTWNIASASRLNVPRVLLPIFNDFPVNFTLEVTEGGCYQWSTSRLDVVHLIPMNENPDHTCSSAVVVQSVSRDLTRNTAIVLAEDINTGQFLRCDVIVDMIYSLNLVTTTRELFIEEAPEAFEVRAQDEQGNEFTTLAGVEFIWTIGNGDKSSSVETADSVLRFITFQESPYETPPTVAMLDGTGKKGSIVLLEGVKTGTAKVAAKLPHLEYKDVPSVEVELIVVANIIIIPTDVTIMAYDNIKYKIMQVHQGRLEEINLPFSQYYLEAEHPDVLDIDNDSGKAYSLLPGKTKVLLHDKNVNEDYSIVLPTAVVHVNSVEYITITVLPNKNRGLILGETHEIVVELFDAKDHKFYIGDGVEVIMTIDSKYFHSKLTSKNGTYVVGVPISCGTTTVEAKLHGVIDKNGKKIPLSTPLVAKADLVIHTPVIISPKILAVPWDPKSKSRLDVPLKASGGDGTYVWNSRQPSIATVSQNGVVRILNQGISDIIVSMARNQYNNDRAKVYVMLPSKLEIIQYSMDAATGEPIHLHVALYGKLNNTPEAKEMLFTDCRDTLFEIYISDNNFVRNATSELVEPIGISCTTLTVVGTDIGSSSITVAYRTNGQYLMDNVTVSAYKPLTSIHPSSAETLLAVGSSRKIIFKGGPHPWTGKINSFTREISVSDEEIVQIDEQDNNGGVSVFKATCRALGQATLTYKVFNKPFLPNCHSTGATAMVKIICGKPRYIYLQPEFKDSKNCPIGNNAERIMVHANQPLKLIVTVKDEDGKRFDNITSLNIEWALKPSGIGLFEVSTGIIEETFVDYNIILPLTHYQTVIPKKHMGTLTISAKIIDYQKYILSKLEITPEWPPFPITTEKGTLVTPRITAEINVLLVNDTMITPSKIKLLNDPNAKYSLQVNQGSGYYEFILSADDIADVRYIEPTKTISIIPKKAGILQIALKDLCLDSTPAFAEIQVQLLAEIEINSINKVEKDKCISAVIKLFDTTGNLIELPSLEAFDLRPEVDNKFIELIRLPINEQGNPPYSQILYMIHGIDEGESRLSFISGFGDKEIRSESNIIQVFMPLKVMQKNITILIGTIYQIMTTGGPANAQIEFTVDDDDIVTINNDGISEGKALGHTRVIAKAVGLDSKGTKIIYSEDFIDIHVIELEGIRIVTPTTRIKVGATIPLWAFGIPDQLTPLVIGSLKSLLVFTWYSSDSNIINLHNMYEGTRINIRYQNEVTLRATALKPGLSTVYLNVTIPSKISSNFKDDVTFSTFLKIEIIEELSLINPDISTGLPVILMTPNSSIKLKTNKDDFGVTSYKIVLSGNSNESDEPNALTTAKTVSVDKNGFVKSGHSLGKTILSITNIESYNRKQSMMIVIDVKPVHYMMLSLSSNVRIRDGEELNILPKGMELTYIVEYFDNIGNKFHAAELKFDTISNRGDLVTFTSRQSSDQINVKFHNNGELVAKVYSDKYTTGLFDYVHMMIGDIIFPSKTVLTVGDIVCFSMPLLSTKTGDPGFWQSSVPEVLSVDAVTGIGRAKTSGQTFVRHSLTDHKQDDIEVNVEPISKISLVSLRGKNITGMEIFSVPLVLKSKDEGIKENNVLARGLGGCRTRTSFTLDSYPFTCTVQIVSTKSSINIKDLFIAKPRFDIVSGFYYCDIIPIGTPTMISSTLDTRIKINAHSHDIEGKALEVIYLPPIYIKSSDITFIKTNPQVIATATLQIYGLKNVLEHSTLQVPEGVIINSYELTTMSTLQFNLRLMPDKDDIQGQKINVINDLTRQNISLVIRTSQNEYNTLSGINWIDCLCYHQYTIITFAIIIITMIWMWKNKIASVNLSVRNTSVFADKSPPPLKKSPNHINANSTINRTINSSSPQRSPESPLRPFSAFEPVYGDPRGFYTPNTRRNISFNCS